MRLIAITTSCARALSAACQLVITLAITLLLVAAGPVAASTVLPTLSGVEPWSARCSTDTCVGLRVFFDRAHAVAVGHPADSPNHWPILAGTDRTADEATFAAATASARERRDLPALAAYLAPDRPVYQRWSGAEAR